MNKAGALPKSCRKSLRRRLLIWLLPATFFVGILASVGTYWGLVIALDAQLDGHMQYIANHLQVKHNGEIALVNRNDRAAHAADDNADEILLQIWENGSLRFTTNPFLHLPAPVRTGQHEVRYGDQIWHIYVAERANGFIQVAQAKDSRWEALARLAVHLFWPVITLVPLIALSVWFGIGYGLTPLREIATSLVQRNANSMAPISEENLPTEIEPVVTALNDLLQRLDESFTVQKSFVADAAHELRTPLMAISIQCEVAQRAKDDMERQTALVQMHAGIQRLTHLVGQLLTLARLGPDARQPGHKPVDLAALCRTVVADYEQAADAKGVDVGFINNGPSVITGDEASLRILLNNLVDNAIRYSSPMGKVDLSAYGTFDGAVLEVRDEGLGIIEGEKNLLWNRFYRGSNVRESGSGLGLSIVKRIAEQNGAVAILENATHGKGLTVRVEFKLV